MDLLADPKYFQLIKTVTYLSVYLSIYSFYLPTMRTTDDPSNLLTVLSTARPPGKAGKMIIISQRG